MAGGELVRKGWHLSETGIKECSEDGNNRIDVIVKNALNTDLREIGAKWVPEGLLRGKLDYVQGPVVLQLSKMKNIAAPKDNEESQGAPRMMKFVLSDGHTSCAAVETEALKNIGFNTAPGCKILIEGTVGVESNILLLNNKNTRHLGGRVERLYEIWELKRSLKYQNRSNIRSEGGPPPFVPFGQKVTSQLPNPRKDNFKSLDTNKEKTGDEKNEFQQQRQAVIAEALQAKDTKTKTFGGGGKIVLEDHDVAKIVDMGFSLEDASNALRFANGNVNEAIHNLLSRGNNSRGRPPKTDKPDRSNDRPERNERNDRGDRFDKKDKMSGRPRRGGNSEEESAANSQPSAPSTLFDFLTTKIPVKEETKPSSGSTYNQKPRNSGTDYNNSSKSNSTVSSNNSSYTSNSTKTNYSARTNNNNNNSTYHEKTHSSYEKPHSSYDKPHSSYDKPHSSYDKPHSSYDKPHSSYDKPHSSYDKPHSSYDKPNSSYDNHNYNNRRQNTVPPRFAQKYGKDSSESSQYSNQSNSYNADSDTSDKTRQKRNENYRNENSRNDYNGGSQDNQRGNKYSQDPRKNDYYDSSSQRSSGASSRASGENKKNTSESTTKSNDTKINSSRNNGGTKSQDSRGSGGNSQTQKTNSKWETRNVSSWNRGEMCLAKYWEDKQFYPAVIENTDPNGVTCIVTFPEYGNTEEVFCTDMMPMPAQNWNEVPQQMNPVQFTAPPPYYPQVPVCPQYQPDPYVVPGQYSTMEFRRGGNGPQYTRKQNDKGRPTQQYYQAPSNKPYQ